MSRLAIPERRTRALPETDFAFRAAADSAPPAFVGHAAVFNSRTAIGNPMTWGFFEEVDPGAFTKTLQEGDARFLVDHDTSLLVARVSAGDLALSVDTIGLAVDAGLDQDLSYVRDLTVNITKRRVTGMSFGFRTIRDAWTTETIDATDSQGNAISVEVDVRTLLEVQLWEVSAVTFPAYEDTDAEIASVATAIALRGDAALVERRSGVPEFLAAYRQIAPENREPAAAAATRGDEEPTDGATPPGEPDAATRQSLDVLRMRHRHLALRHGMSQAGPDPTSN